MARKIRQLEAAREEILVLTSASLLRTWPMELISRLADFASRRGTKVKIHLRQSGFFSGTRLERLRAAGVQVQIGKRRLRSPKGPQQEVWIFDRKSAIAGNRDLREELSSLPSEGRISLECPLHEGAARAAARYFDHCWSSEPASVSLTVRQKDFIFRGGGAAEEEFFDCLARTKREARICLTEARLPRRLFHALTEALARGLKLTIYVNTKGLERLSNRMVFRKLLKSGAELRFTAAHLMIDSSWALLDESGIYVGPFPGQNWSFRAMANAVVYIDDSDSHLTLRANLEQCIFNKVSLGNSSSLLSSAHSLKSSRKL